MKKLILIICIGITIISCKQKSANTKVDKLVNTSSSSTLHQPPDTLHITLNGIDELTADTMRGHFMRFRGQDVNPTRECVFFDSLTIQRIVNLLYKEIAEEKSIDSTRTDTTDGIRIYFGSYINITTGQLKNTVLLVSTKNDGVAPDSVPSKAYHKDYYIHSKKDILFSNLSAINGMVSPKGVLKGETSYNPCINCNDTPNCAKNMPHYITRKTIYTMLKNFKNKPITTQSEWFDLGLFKSFADDHVHDGLRVYFGRHGVTGKNANKEAFVLVTTKGGSLLYKHEDYFDCSTTNPYFLRYYKINGWDKAHHPLFSNGGQDNGELCPANCTQ